MVKIIDWTDLPHGNYEVIQASALGIGILGMAITLENIYKQKFKIEAPFFIQMYSEMDYHNLNHHLRYKRLFLEYDGDFKLKYGGLTLYGITYKKYLEGPMDKAVGDL